MNILETFENNNRLNFYIILILLVIVFMIPTRIQSTRNDSKNLKNIAVQVKEFTNHIILK